MYFLHLQCIEKNFAAVMLIVTFKMDKSPHYFNFEIIIFTPKPRNVKDL